jgi:peptide-methionine (S)-S-oxide reductase
MTAGSRTERATFGGGCFWCLDAVYRQLRGVTRVTSGYAGGHDPRPAYEAVCSGVTGHAEVVQVEFDPALISYADLLHVLFTIHDPTTPDRQGADVGTQYRSIILFENEEQERTARDVIAKLERDGTWGAPIVTQVERLERFHPAEAYHQDYFAQHRTQPYCRIVIEPKVAKMRKQFMDRLSA